MIELELIQTLMKDKIIDENQLSYLNSLHIKYFNESINKKCSNCINEAITKLYKHLTLNQLLK